MKIIKLFGFLFLLNFIACKNISPSEQLQALITDYEKPREYDFKRGESLENTTKFYEAEANYATNLIAKIENVATEDLSETDKISRELLLFVLQDKISQHTFKMYLNPITNESAFHLRLNRIANKTLKNEKDVKKYFEQLEKLPIRVDYNLALLNEGVKEGISQPKEVFYEYDKTYNKHIVADVIKNGL